MSIKAKAYAHSQPRTHLNKSTKGIANLEKQKGGVLFFLKIYSFRQNSDDTVGTRSTRARFSQALGNFLFFYISFHLPSFVIKPRVIN